MIFYDNAEYTEYLESCYKHRNDAAVVQYLNSRGISQETADKFKIGYDADKELLIFNCSERKNIGRYINPDALVRFEEIEYNNFSFESHTHLFNTEILENIDRPIFVTEGVFDALSIIEAGGVAIALNHQKNDFSYLRLHQICDKKFIFCMDRDAKGTETICDIQKSIKLYKKEFNADFIIADICKGYADVNEALINDREGFIKAVRAAEFEANAKQKQCMEYGSASTYLQLNIYESDIEYFKKYKDRKTGFEDIDKHLTLYPGLAALGGASSLGKTTFAVNLIDRLLQRGETVLYFSLEQLPIEIITKSLTRRLCEKKPNTMLTNIDIKNGATSPQFEAVKKEYAEMATNYHIITGSFRMTAANIVQHVEEYIAKHGGESCKPIVIIDYLQLIAPPANFKGGMREYTDENIKTLKDMQKRNELFVLMISNFNRSSNYEPVSYESFKETGMIEYTCDYIWGLQLSVLDAENEEFYTTEAQKGRKERPIDQKRKMINEEQTRNPKRVEFVSLKNRNGKQFFKAYFKYYPQFDYYVKDDEAAEDAKSFSNVMRRF